MAIRYTIIEIHPLLIAVATILISSCVQPLEIKADWDEPPVVVHCVLTQDNKQTVELYYASAIGEDSFSKVQEATVTVKGENKYDFHTFTNERNGVWTAEFKPSFDCTYSLEIEIPGRETITATTRTPEQVGVFMRNIVNRDHSNSVDGPVIKAAGYTPPWEEMGGGVLGRIVGNDGNNTKHDIYVWIRHSLGYDLATDHIYADDCNVTSRTYSADLFKPEELAGGKINGKGIVPFCFGLPLHKGFLRIVNPVDYCRSIPNKYGVISRWDHDGNREVRAAPEYDKAFVILGDFTYVTPTGEQTREDIKDYLEAWVVSEELDKYYRDVYSFQNTNMDNLFNMVYASGDLISSNIKNGFGIFGAKFIIREQAISGYNW